MAIRRGCGHRNSSGKLSFCGRDLRLQRNAFTLVNNKCKQAFSKAPLFALYGFRKDHINIPVLRLLQDVTYSSEGYYLRVLLSA